MQVSRAYNQAYDAFQTVLSTLVAELVFLRQPLLDRVCSTPDLASVTLADVTSKTIRTEPVLPDNEYRAHGPVAARMIAASTPYAQRFRLSPMIAVAGSVADHVMQCMLSDTTLKQAYVNNGGDIALWLAPDQQFSIGICDNLATGHINTRLTIQAWHNVKGIATSGWRGRSHSLGIADAVTVLAPLAADADAAATLIANAVDVPGASGIHRLPANELSPDSDLGDTPVTVAVDTLDSRQIRTALNRGKLCAEQLLEMGRIKAAYISLDNRTVVCSTPLCTQCSVSG